MSYHNKLIPQEMKIMSSQNYTNEDAGESRVLGQTSYSSSELFEQNKGSLDKQAMNSQYMQQKMLNIN